MKPTILIVLLKTLLFLRCKGFSRDGFHMMRHEDAWRDVASTIFQQQHAKSNGQGEDVGARQEAAYKEGTERLNTDVTDDGHQEFKNHASSASVLFVEDGADDVLRTSEDDMDPNLLARSSSQSQSSSTLAHASEGAEAHGVFASSGEQVASESQHTDALVQSWQAQTQQPDTLHDQGQTRDDEREGAIGSHEHNIQLKADIALSAGAATDEQAAAEKNVHIPDNLNTQQESKFTELLNDAVVSHNRMHHEYRAPEQTSMVNQAKSIDHILQLYIKLDHALKEKNGADALCHAELHADYRGEQVIKWGPQNFKDTAGDCCSDCVSEPACNVWVYCPNLQGCGAGSKPKECWLKKASLLALRRSLGHVQPDIQWTSGSIMSDSEHEALMSGKRDRAIALLSDRNTPLVYIDVSISGEPAGRVTIALFTRQTPQTSEHFRLLCTGEQAASQDTLGSSLYRSSAGSKYWLKGAPFYHIIHNLSLQFGMNMDSSSGQGTAAINAAELRFKHDRPGLVSMVRSDSNTMTGHFSILLTAAPKLDGVCVVIGEVVEGWDVLARISDQANGDVQSVGQEAQVVISDAGQLRGPGLADNILA